jgi:hypothetical protein
MITDTEYDAMYAETVLSWKWPSVQFTDAQTPIVENIAEHNL